MTSPAPHLRSEAPVSGGSLGLVSGYAAKVPTRAPAAKRQWKAVPRRETAALPRRPGRIAGAAERGATERGEAGVRRRLGETDLRHPRGDDGALQPPWCGVAKVSDPRRAHDVQRLLDMGAPA